MNKYFIMLNRIIATGMKKKLKLLIGAVLIVACVKIYLIETKQSLLSLIIAFATSYIYELFRDFQKEIKEISEEKENEEMIR